jgi:hypothetical protein
MTEIAVQSQEAQSSICMHETLVTLSPMPNFTHRIMCNTCGKKLIIDCLRLETPPCIVAQIEEAFGPAWGAEAAKVCQCKQHSKRGEL